MKLNLLLSALCLSAAFAQDLSFDPTDTALVLTDLQNDFLSQDGVAWGGEFVFSLLVDLSL